MKLEEYEENCPDCEGSGWLNKLHGIECEKCLGTGKLDWLEKIRGKRSINREKFIIKNNTNKNIIINDLQEFEIKSKSYYNLLNIFDISELQNSWDLNECLETGAIVIEEENIL